MRLHRDAILWPQHMKIQRRHQGRHRSAAGLVTAHFQSIAARTDVIGIVNRPAGQPEQPLLQGIQSLNQVIAAQLGLQ